MIDYAESASVLSKTMLDQRAESALAWILVAKKNPVSEYLARIGKKGGKASGKARLEKMAPEVRSELARRAAEARWKDKPKVKTRKAAPKAK